MSFMRSLASFAQEANLTAILLNNAASSKQASLSFPGLAQLNHGMNLPPSTFISEPQANASFSASDHVSIFSSTTVQPALGRAFNAVVDCHLLISMLPKRKKDAEILIGGKSGKADVVHVIEVLSERDGGGHARWAAFEVAENGTRLKPPA